MATSKDQRFILGLYVGTRSVDGILVEIEGAKREIIGQYTKALAESGSLEPSDVASLVPGMKSTEDDDYTLEIGSGGQGGGSDLFLASEWETMGVKGGEHADQSVASKSERTKRTHFEPQFREILAEATKTATEVPQLAFCGTPPDFEYHILSPDTTVDEKSLIAQRSARKALLKELSSLVEAPVRPDRAGFLDMSGKDERPRYLAVVRAEEDSIVQTYRMEQALNRSTLPGIAAIDAEVSLIAAMISDSTYGDEGKMTAAIRVGSEETLIVFFHGDQIIHIDHLRSINIYDAPETVCSRVMLQQDEQKIGELDHVLLLANSRSEALRTTFVRYYPDSQVLHFQRLLMDEGLTLDEEAQPLRTGKALATAVALSLPKRAKAESKYLNFIPQKLGARKKKRIELGWHTLLMMPVLFLVAFFFVTRYLQRDAEIESRRAELMMNPPAPPVTNPDILQARVDSLDMAYQRYTRALYLLDSLLVGSDKWSRFLETVTRSTRDLSGVWLSRWNPAAGSVTIDGFALSRSRVSQFARRLDAIVESVSSREISDADKTVRVYEFTVVAPVPHEMPEVAKHLMEQPLGEPPSGPPGE
jgi:hypothetical protein